MSKWTGNLTSTDSGPIYPYSVYLPIVSKLQVGDLLIYMECVGYLYSIRPYTTKVSKKNTIAYYIRWFPQPPKGRNKFSFTFDHILCDMFAEGMQVIKGKE